MPAEQTHTPTPQRSSSRVSTKPCTEHMLNTPSSQILSTQKGTQAEPAPLTCRRAVLGSGNLRFSVRQHWIRPICETEEKDRIAIKSGGKGPSSVTLEFKCPSMKSQIIHTITKVLSLPSHILPLTQYANYIFGMHFPSQWMLSFLMRKKITQKLHFVDIINITHPIACKSIQITRWLSHVQAVELLISRSGLMTEWKTDEPFCSPSHFHLVCHGFSFF